MDSIRQLLSQPAFLVVWAVQAVVALAWLTWDLARRNARLGTLMKLVWGLTVAYSGLLGLAVYHFSGRRQISRDSIWRRAWRSVSHCYSGCGAGEILGVLIATGLFSVRSNLAVGLITFSLAYLMGFALTVGPLMGEGESPGQAIRDAFWGESVSITAMELSAILVDLALARQAKIDEPLYWASLIVSLTIGLLVAYPFNLALIHFGVKEGMMSPKDAAD